MNAPPAEPCRVVKIGGSLLELADLRQRLDRWLASQAAMRTLLVVGGGTTVDLLRSIDRHAKLPVVETHWTCIAVMTVNAWRLANDWRLPLRTAQEFVTMDDRLAFLNAEPTLRLPPAEATPLPESWDVTSDSIAAWVGTNVEAQEVVLFKSCLPEARTYEAAAAVGYVDRHFPMVAAGWQQVRCVDLRANPSSTADQYPEATLNLPP